MVFDCDGTLVDSAALILAAMDRAFARADRPPPAETAVRSIVGLSLAEAMAALLPEEDAAVHVDVAEHYRRSFAELRTEGIHDERLFPGLADLLDELDRTGRLLAVATGKSRRGLDHLVDKHGWHGRFVSLQTADRHPSKPHPAMLLQAVAEAGVKRSQAVMIGDTSYDMAMARSARVAGIGVTWGHHPEVLLRDAGADHVVADVDALRGLLLS
ncbi:MAG: HAD-IA family hydrolase [Pseudomonadota bacterium]